MNQTKNIAAAGMILMWISSAIVLFFLSFNLLGTSGAVLPIIVYLFVTVIVVEERRKPKDIGY
jgi:hypothetical protein